MKRLLAGLLLIAVVGCDDASSIQAADADPAVAALEKLGASFNRNEQGEVIEVDLESCKITDAGLVHLVGQTNLLSLDLSINANITGAGMVHLNRGS